MNRKLLISALAILAIAAPATLAVADDEPTAPSEVKVVSSGKTDPRQVRLEEAKALQVDAATIAKEVGGDAKQTLLDLEWQNLVNAEVTRLRAANPKVFGGARILSHEKRAVWLGFTGKVDGVAMPKGTNLELDAKLAISEADMGEATILAAEVAQKLTEVEVSAAPDTMTGVIDVVLSRAERSGDAAVADKITEALRSNGHQVKVNLVFDPKATGALEDAYGGAKLEYRNSGSLQCTSAFTVIKNNRRSILTAQHCNSGFTHENSNGATELSTWTEQSYYGSGGDLRHYGTTDVERARFRADYSDLRTLHTAPGFSEGSFMCHFGYGNGKSCDRVYRINTSSGGAGHLTAMHRHYTTGGNSGGPWFLGTSGYGVHHGYKTIWFRGRSLFTPLNRVWPAFNAYILVS